MSEVSIKAYIDWRPSLYLEDLWHDFKNSLGKFKNDDEAFGTLLGLVELDRIYSSALKEISTKPNTLDDNFNYTYKHNSIHCMERHVKEMRSLIRELNRKRLQISAETAKEHILDVAEIRVVCNYLDDIYLIGEMLLKQEDVQSIKRKDCTQHPRENGYRSLHIVVSIPVFLAEHVEVLPVEIQIGTIGMDMWASLEHKIRYKNNVETEEYRDLLKECAAEITEVEDKLQQIHSEITE